MDGAPQHAGQSYMRKFFGSEEDLIEPTRTHNVESERGESDGLLLFQCFFSNFSNGARCIQVL